MAGSLAAGTGLVAGLAEGPGWQAARLLDHGDPRRARHWHPAAIGGQLVLFAGFVANGRAIAADLGMAWPERPGPDDYARLYGAHLAQHGTAGELGLVGEYAAAVFDPAAARLILVRSPLRAPPLHFRLIEGGIVAGSVPRVLFAPGGIPRLDRSKLADSAWFNYGSDRLGWYEGTDRLLPGTRLELHAGELKRTRYYDPAALPEVRLPRPGDYVEAALALLDEGVKSSLQGSSRPGVLLSGGLDSAIVAARAAAMLPEGRALDAYTFVPQADWDGRSPPGTFGDEGPAVAEFAKLHPQIQPHFFDNHGLGFDHRMAEMFHHTGIAPINLANFSSYHEPLRAARASGCDVVLLPEWGNDTFSNAGEWAPIEYLLKLRWGELVRALKTLPDDPRPLWRRLVGSSLLPLLPPRLWRWQRALRGIADKRELASPLRADFVRSQQLLARADMAAGGIASAAPRSRRAWLRGALGSGSDDSADIWQGFEQIHGLTIRDPAAYRPLAEFCFGLPTDMFVRQGEWRWLAREMGRGLLPEAQRTNRRSGRHNADWLAKLAPKRQELRDELTRLAMVPDMAEMLDIPRLIAALDAWPAETPTGMEGLELQIAVTRGITVARFIKWAEGRNDW